MRIKQQLGLMIGIPVIGLLAIGALQRYTDYRLEVLQEHRDVAEEIILGVAELQFLSTDFLTYREERAAAQWRRRHHSLGQLLASYHPHTVEEAEALHYIQRSHAALGELFVRLARASNDDESVADKVTAHIIDRILAASASVITSATRLAKSSAAEADALRADVRDWRLLIGFLVLVVSALVMLLIGRNLVTPIVSLQRTVASVRAGEYATTTGVHRRDELGDLARAFDGMIVALKDETARREESERQLAAGQQALKSQADELARSNAELEQFAYVASHDLQEPLRTISSYTQLLHDRYAGKLDSDGVEFIQFAVDGAARMQRLIRDLLTFSRTTRSAAPLRSIELGAVVETALKNLTQLIDDSDAAIRCDPLPSVYGDPGQLTQVFQNLLSNALKFRAEERPPQVHIRAARMDRMCQIQVIDNGIGFEDRYSEQVFEPFRRLHGGDRYPGSGIGLALCKKLIARHGGKIWVESRPGNGSRFSFTVAFVEADRVVEDVAA